jgi:hypothetical protein
MNDWQKVRIQFTDASGEEVSAVMWTHPSYANLAYKRSDLDNLGMCFMWAPRDQVTVTPIRELPTGLGAVVSVEYGLPINDVENYVYMGDDWWGTRDAKDIRSENLAELKFTVLSEGIEP